MDRLETLRQNLRRRNLTSNLAADHPTTHIANNTLETIKDFLKTAKDYKSKLQLSTKKKSAEDAIGKERTMAFIIGDLQQSLHEVEEQLSKDVTSMTDNELKRMKDECKHLPSKLENISTNYTKILQLPITDGDALYSIKIIGDLYSKLNSTKTRFITDVNEEYLRRELDKDQAIDHLNIKL